MCHILSRLWCAIRVFILLSQRVDFVSIQVMVASGLIMQPQHAALMQILEGSATGFLVYPQRVMRCTRIHESDAASRLR